MDATNDYEKGTIIGKSDNDSTNKYGYPREEDQTNKITFSKEITIQRLIDALEKKDGTILDLQAQLTKANDKIFNLMTIDKRKLEKTIEDNTQELNNLSKKIDKLENTIRELRLLSQPNPITDEEEDEFLSEYIGYGD